MSSSTNPKQQEQAKQALRDVQKQLAAKFKEVLEKADANPIGHVGCDMIRGDVQGDPMSPKEAMERLFNALFELPEENKKP